MRTIFSLTEIINLSSWFSYLTRLLSSLPSDRSIDETAESVRQNHITECFYTPAEKNKRKGNGLCAKFNAVPLTDRISSRMCSENPRAASFESASRRLSSAVNRPVWFHRIDSDQHRKSIQNELFSSASQEKQMTIIRCRSLLSKIVRIDQINKPLE